MQDSRLPGFVLRRRGDTPADKHALAEIEAQQHATMSSYIPEMYSEQLKEVIFAMLRADPAARITAAQILQLPFIQEWKQRLTRSPPTGMHLPRRWSWWHQLNLTRCVAVSLCRCVAVSLCRCVAVSLCRSLCVAPVDALESLLLCRRFHWEGATWVYTRKGDITQEEADVIVVPNDPSFTGTSGLSKIICQRNPEMREALVAAIAERGGTPGMAVPIYVPVAASENGIRARSVIHVVGPMKTTTAANHWLEKTFDNCLHRAIEAGARSVCFPAIGTGGAMIAAEDCARCFFRVIRRMSDADLHLSSITLLCSDNATLRAFSEAYSTIIEQGKRVL
jgi:O-acetyl-ADP-ribose deacetylase (regulator of RNase III)